MAGLLALGALGSAIGSFLNVVVWRVPRGLSVVAPPSACGSCGHPIRWFDNIPLVSWLALRARCRDCGSPISARYPLVEAGSAVAFLAVGGRFLPDVLGAAGAAAAAGAIAVLLAYLYLAAISLALAIIDGETQRLPNVIVVPAYGIMSLLLVVAALLTGSWAAFVMGVAGFAGLGLLYALPALVRPGAMGGGDIKLAALLGLALGFLGWPTLGVGVIAGFLLGGVYGVVLLAIGRGRGRRVAFGPWMLAGAWIGILAGPQISSAYLALFGLG